MVKYTYPKTDHANRVKVDNSIEFQYIHNVV
jgi:hypothetical protein